MKFCSTQGFLFLLSSYILVHFSLRLLLFPALDIDDAEQAIFAQSWQWGYGTKQPPLYTWILMGLYKVFGINLFSHVFLKYILLFLLYWFSYRASLVALRDQQLATYSAFSLLLIYVIGYGVHQGFTHTLLLAVFVAFGTYEMLRLRDSVDSKDYVQLGFATGLGMLSKYNFVIFILAWMITALGDAKLRQRLFDIRFMFTVLIAVALVLPHWAWLAAQQDWYELGQFLGREENPRHAYLQVVSGGLRTYLEAIFIFLSPLWLFFLAFFPKAWLPIRNGCGACAECLVLIRRYLLAALLIVAALVLILKLPYIKQRWLHPVLLLFPLFFFLRVQSIGTSPKRLAGFGWTLFIMAVFVIGFRIAEFYVGPRIGEPIRISKPYPKLTMEIRDRGFSGGTIIAADRHIAGNFHLSFPDSRVVSLSHPYYVPPIAEDHKQCLLVWNAKSATAAQKAIIDFVEANFAGRISEPLPVLDIHVGMSSESQANLHLQYVLIKDRTERCSRVREVGSSEGTATDRYAGK